jgi:arylsulfatase A-like enzyme/cytochrome c-type biogenesis protein CcmH/NrfG
VNAQALGLTPSAHHDGTLRIEDMRSLLSTVAVVAVIAVLAGCTPTPPASSSAAAKNLVLITIDTLRADRVGAYGYQPARTPTFDAVANAGVRFDRAYATAPITLTSHASLLTGRYPPGHGARHNGMAMNANVATLATALDAGGFATGAFISAFPLDRRFGLQRGFDVYDDVTERGSDGRPLNERAGPETARRARVWLDAHRRERFFLWLHVFDPHAPYGDPQTAGSRSVAARYDDEIATADRAAALVLDGLGDAAASTLVVMTSDHGEAFGEHEEIGHSIFVYDTTLRVPLVMRGPAVPAGRALAAPVTLADVAPTTLALLGVTGFDADGIDLSRVMQSDDAGDRSIYAESFAPLFDFGWSPLRSVRDTKWKYIAAPKPELYDVNGDPAEARNVEATDPRRAAQLLARVDRFGPADASAMQSPSAEAANRLRALGYLSGGRSTPQSARPDPKDRIALASRIAMVTSGEVRGQELIATLRAILREDPKNPQANLRLGYAELEQNRCAQAEPHFRAAIAGELPSADAALGLADCRMRANDAVGAERALELARAVEPGNPVVDANLGLVALSRKDATKAIQLLRSALARDPGFFEARFNLSRALATAGQRAEALKEAHTLLSQMPPTAPQRAEVERLVKALQ